MGLIIWFIRIIGFLCLLTYFPLQYAMGLDPDPVNVTSFILMEIAYFIIGIMLICFATPLVDKIKKFFKWLFPKKQNKSTSALILIFIILVCSLYPLHVFSITKYYSPTNLRNVGVIFLIGSREVVSVGNLFVNSFSMPFEVDRDKLEMPVYDIYLRQHKIDSLESDLPESGRDYKNGFVEFNNETLPVKIKYRGGFSHWTMPKKSLAIKYNRSDVTNFTRRFDFIVPEKAMQFEKTFYDYIGKQFNLLSPDVEDVAVFLNRKYYGHFQKYEYVDESFLRKNNRFPGMIYKGDYANVFYHPEEWDIRATFTDDNDTQSQLIHIFTNNITSATYLEFYDFYMNHMTNMEAYMAYVNFLGDEHINDNHNQLYYFDPSNGRFEPIVNDPTIFPIYTNLNKGGSLLFRRLYKYPNIVAEKNKILYDYVTSDKIEELQKLLDELESKNSYAIKKDFYKAKDNSNYFISYTQWKNEVQRIRERIDLFSENIKKDLETVDVTVYYRGGGDKVTIDVSGHVPINIVNQTLYPGLKEVIRKGWRDVKEYEPATLRYEFNINEWPEVLPNITNYLTGELINFMIYYDFPPELNETYSLHPDTYIVEEEEIKEYYYENMIFTTSMSFQGVNVKFFKVAFVGGYENDVDLVHYSGQLSVHNANLTCIECTFLNSNTEDMINVKNGNSTIINSTFINAKGDAIDLDMSTGLIKGNVFINITNDAIDLMTSDPVIYNNTIINAGDKGMSIGEKSLPAVGNNTIRNSKFGIVSKDGSVPLLVNNIIENSTIADLAAYAKNWRYSDGGHGILINNIYDTILFDSNVTGEPYLDYFESGFAIITPND